jgi:hypothetical protein
MGIALIVQTLGAVLYKIQNLVHGKDMRMWKHPYWQSALTTIGEMLPFIVYFIKQRYFKLEET